MFCVNCGVRLGDTEEKCPLCGTVVYHPDIQREAARPLYPAGRMPRLKPRSKVLNGVVILLFLIPLLVSLSIDWQDNGRLNWFGYVAGALVLAYVTLGLPFWFEKPHPVIFVPCDFAAVAAYLLYIDLVTGGGWFLPFAFPVTGGLCVITSTVVTLLCYLRKGKLIWGGALMALGAFTLLVEFLMTITFALRFSGWSLYPLIVLGLIGGMLIYLGINRSAREIMERKLFF